MANMYLIDLLLSDKRRSY